MKIRIIFGGANRPEHQFRVLEDLLPYEDAGVSLSLSYNIFGPAHVQTDIEHSLGRAGMASAAIAAEQEGADAIVIESMGDTGLLECREAVNIPVVGMTDSSVRVAQMLGRNFGIITAGKWHGYSLERIMRSYGLLQNYVGFEALNVQPFFEGSESQAAVHKSMISAIDELMAKGADTIVFGGSYFIGKEGEMAALLKDAKYKDLLFVDPLPLAIRFARMLVDAKLSQNKRIYMTPTAATPVVGFPLITSTPGARS